MSTERDCYLHDCVTQTQSERTAFICHSSVAQKFADLRDRYSQGVISLANLASIDGVALDEALDCQAIMSIIAYFGTGICIGDPNSFNLGQLRYGRLVLVNADEVEPEFTANVLVAIHVLLSPVIENQHLWIADVDLANDDGLIDRTLAAARVVVLGSSAAQTVKLNLS